MIPLKQKGSLLIEILVAVSIFGVVAAIAAQTIVASLMSNTAAAAKGAEAQMLAEELQGIHAASDESWQALYATVGGAHYYASLSGGKWSIASGDDSVTLDTRTYGRYFTTAAVSRDPTTRAIEATYLLAHDDPSTLLVHVFVNSSTTASVSADEYVLRWRNQACSQSSWTASGSTGAKTCPDTTYVNSVNITPGASLQLCSGGC